MRRPFRSMPPLGPPDPTDRQRVLAQWRGADWVPSEIEQRNSARTAAEVMAKVLPSLRLDQRQSEAQIRYAWNDLLDANITAHAQPVGLNKGTLFVTVDSNTWLSEIVRYHRSEILERVQNAFGREMIQRISFRLG